MTSDDLQAVQRALSDRRIGDALTRVKVALAIVTMTRKRAFA